jgi:hypothetical protein
LFVAPDFKWEIFYGDSVNNALNALAATFVTAGTAPNGSGAHIFVPLSADSAKRVLFEVVRAIWQVNSGRRARGKVPERVIARLVKSVEQATKQMIKGE